MLLWWIHRVHIEGAWEQRLPWLWKASKWCPNSQKPGEKASGREKLVIKCADISLKRYKIRNLSLLSFIPRQLSAPLSNWTDWSPWGLRAGLVNPPQFSSHLWDVFTNQLVPLITVREFTDLAGLSLSARWAWSFSVGIFPFGAFIFSQSPGYQWNEKSLC